MIINFTKNFVRFPALLFFDTCFRSVTKCFTGEVHLDKSDLLTPSDPVQSGVFWHIMSRPETTSFIVRALQDNKPFTFNYSTSCKKHRVHEC